MTLIVISLIALILEEPGIALILLIIWLCSHS